MGAADLLWAAALPARDIDLCEPLLSEAVVCACGAEREEVRADERRASQEQLRIRTASRLYSYSRESNDYTPPESLESSDRITALSGSSAAGPGAMRGNARLEAVNEYHRRSPGVAQKFN